MGAAQDFYEALPHGLNVLTLLFLCLSIALIQWSTADVTTTQGATGTAQIGVWKACSEMDPVNTVVFSAVSSCRQGHCVKSEKIATQTSRSNEGLCNKASAVGAFGILAIFFCVAAILMTTFRSVMSRTILWWKGMVYNLAAAFCSMLAWSIWASWQSQMNDQENNASIDQNLFSEFEYGGGFILQVISFIFLVLNFFLCRINAKTQEKTLNRLKITGKMDALNPNISINTTTDLGDGNYVDVPDPSSNADPAVEEYIVEVVQG